MFGVWLTTWQYGIIKKLENFWKGLSSDRSQISALAPQQYGERFYNFITGVTMSQEQATREAQEKDAATAAAVAAEEEERHRASSTVPPIPNHLPPPPPSSSLAERSPPEAEAVVQRAEQEARRSSDNGPESEVPERILRTTVTSPKHGPVTTPGAGSTVLPIVEEAAENSTMGERGRDSRISSTMTGESEYRPLTPAKDGREAEAGFGNPILGGHGGYRPRAPPPTPPKTGHGYGGGKPESADSGYGVVSGNGGLRSATGSQRSLGTQPQISRDSLDKALPPLPRAGEHPVQGVS
jgi:1-phosphatidylinositol-4-phosphate 5-kinase